MAAERKHRGLIIAALVGGYLLLRPDPAAASSQDGGAAGAGGAGGGSGGGKTTLLGNVSKALPTVVKVGGAVAGAAGTLAGVSTGAAAGALLFEAAGVGLGYEQDGVVGAIAGGLNPIAGNFVIAGAKGAGALASAAGANTAATDTSEVSGGVLAGVATLGSIAAAAALLPTVGIAVGLAELLGAIFGSGPAAPPLSPLQQVDVMFKIASGQQTLPFEPPDAALEFRAAAAAQLVAWALGPDQRFDPSIPPFGGLAPNLYKPAARTDCLALGMGSLIGVGTAPIHH